MELPFPWGAGIKLVCSKQEDPCCLPPLVILLCSDHVWLVTRPVLAGTHGQATATHAVCVAAGTQPQSAQILVSITLLNISTLERDESVWLEPAASPAGWAVSRLSNVLAEFTAGRAATAEVTVTETAQPAPAPRAWVESGNCSDLLG